MERIALLHSRLQLTITAVLMVLLIWGLICTARNRVGQGYTAALWIGQLLITAQCVLGVMLLLGGTEIGRLALHIIYGIVAVSCLPAALQYNRGRATRWEALVFAATCLFLLGVIGRAYETAP